MIRKLTRKGKEKIYTLLKRAGYNMSILYGIEKYSNKCKIYYIEGEIIKELILLLPSNKIKQQIR